MTTHSHINPGRGLSWRRLVAVTAATVIAIMTAGSGSAATTATCSYYAGSAGNDSNNGSITSPYRSVAKLAGALVPGQTGCILGGNTLSGDVNLSKGGQSGAPITITGADPDHPSTILGRIVTKPGGDWITLSNLRLDGRNSAGLPSPTIGSAHVSLLHNEITNGHTAICVNVIDDTSWGVGSYATIDANRIHDCGKLPATNHDHGIYVIGPNATVTNNYIYDNADRGVQLRGATNAVVRNNVIDGNGEGVIFGDMAASGNAVSDNIVSNSTIRANAESYWGSTPVGTGNSFTSNCTFATNANSSYNANGGVDTGSGGYSASGNTVGNPNYVNRSAADFRLNAGSPCANDGVQSGVVPGPTATAGVPAPVAAPAVVTAPAVTGSTLLGSMLTASTGTWSGTGNTYAIAWQRCTTASSCSTIAGATSATYVTAIADTGLVIRVLVTATNAGGTVSASSAPTAAVTAPAPTPEPVPAPTPAPAPVATFAITQTLTAGATVSGGLSWMATPTGGTAASVDFLVDGALVNTELSAPYGSPCDTCTFDTTTLQNGSHTFTTRATSTGGTTATVNATLTINNQVATPAPLPAPAPTPEPVPAPTPAPAPVATFAITQTLTAGATVSGGLSWMATPTGGTAASVDFLVDGALVNTELSAPYGSPCDTCTFDTTTLQNGSHTFTTRATSTGGTTATVNATLTINNQVATAPKSTALPTISGTARRSSTLTARTGTWSGTSPITFTYKWLRCSSTGNVTIAGATGSTYRLGSADVGRTIRVVVTARNAAGTATATSAATATVR